MRALGQDTPTRLNVTHQHVERRWMLEPVVDAGVLCRVTLLTPGGHSILPSSTHKLAYSSCTISMMPLLSKNEPFMAALSFSSATLRWASKHVIRRRILSKQKQNITAIFLPFSPAYYYYFYNLIFYNYHLFFMSK